MITQNTGLSWGRTGGSMSRCRPQVGQHRPPPLRPPFPGSSTSTWGESGWWGGMGIRGRGAEWGSSIPQSPPISPGPAPARPCDTTDYLSPQWALTTLPSFLTCGVSAVDPAVLQGEERLCSRFTTLSGVHVFCILARHIG